MHPMESPRPKGTPSRYNLFSLGDSLKKLHELALVSKQKLEETFEDGTLAVAILDHRFTPDTGTHDNFHWFKLKPVSCSDILLLGC